MTTLGGIFGEPFAEQVAAFRLRLGNLVPTAKWDDIKRAQHDRGFMVARAIKADLLADLGAAVDKAIAKGTSLEEFRRDFRAIVQKNGWHGWTGEGTKGGEAWRTRLIYKTNLSVTYAAGRMAQLVEAGFTLWVYRHGASLEPREQHLAWDGLILPPDHPFWATHAPPNGWGCSCYVLGARSIRGAVRLGGKPDLKLPDNWQALDPKTGAPVGIDKGWDYSPGASVTRTITTLADKLVALPAMTGADLIASWPDMLYALWAKSFQTFMDTVLADVPRGRMTIAGAMLPKWIAELEARGVLPQTAEIAIREADIRHIFRASKKDQLAVDWFRDLPLQLRAPEAVVLDTTHGEPALLLIYGNRPGVPKLVLRVNYFVKKQGRFNVIETGKTVDPSGIRAQIGKGMELIDGSLGPDDGKM